MHPFIFNLNLNFITKMEQASLWTVPESDTGNKEYKLKLLDDSIQTIDHLTSQMRYRLEEGSGECFYNIGITDNGEMIGLSPQEYEKTFDILQKVCNKNNYYINLLSTQKIDKEKNVYEFVVREKNPIKYIDIKVGIGGNVDSGKSSLLGTLISGIPDDGRGLARTHVFNFQHELKSGRTSSIAQHILGFDFNGNAVNYGDIARKKPWSEIVQKSTKIVTFFDMCGHEKYLKTTISGITSQRPDLIFILVGANMGITQMTKEHIFLCLSLQIPFVVVISKVDICKDRPQILDSTTKEVKQLIKSPGLRRIPYDVRTKDDIIVCVKNVNTLSTVPIFYVSSLTSEGIDSLRTFLNLYNKKVITEENKNKIEYHVDQIFHVPGVGNVLGGQFVKGKIKIGDKLIVGPENNNYYNIQVKSIHCKRVSVEEVNSGCYVCLAVKKPDDLILRRGLVVLSQIDSPDQIIEFEAEIIVMKSHSTTIKVGYQPMLHSNSVRQTCEIVSIRNKQCSRSENMDEILRTGDRGIVKFKFKYNPEYIKQGDKALFCEGRTKLIGKIISVFSEKINVK